jgi:intraflagellar transport protein 56
MHDPEPEASVWLWKAVCKYGMGQYKDAEECAFRGPQGQLQNRILFHVAHKLGEETQLINYHHRLTSSIEDQLSLAGMHFLRGHYQEATDLYKRILLEQVCPLDAS